MKKIKNLKHSKCKGWINQHGEGECDYNTTVSCDDCRYLLANNGRGKNPAAKSNQIK